MTYASCSAAAGCAPNSGQGVIRPLARHEAGWAAALHARLMDESVLALFGVGLLRLFYKELARSSHAFALALEEGGRPMGAIAVMARRRAFARAFILRRGPELACRMCWGLLTRRACRRLLLRLPRYWASAETGPDGAEMLFIVVEPAAQGKGVARRLIEAALLELRRRGASRVSVAVATAHPLIGRLLRSLGFAPVTGLDFAEKQHEVLAMELAPPLEARTLPQEETA